MLAIAALMVSCSAPAKVQRVADRGILGLKRVGPNDDLGVLLDTALDKSDPELARSALGQFVERWNVERDSAATGEVTGASDRYHVSFPPSLHGGYALDYFDEVSPAAEFRVRRIKHKKRDGIGAPLVAVRENRHTDPLESFYPNEAITRPLTAVIVDKGTSGGVRQVDLELLCPLVRDDVEVNGESVPLAADFTVPWASLLSRMGKLNRSQLTETFRVQPRNEPRLFLMEPYNPAKEPLIMVHGLMDTPLVWAKLSNDLWADDEIRRRYQIWHFLYNTSAPALYAGRILSKQLRELRPLLDPTGKDPAMQRTTVLAHSMGGLVSRRLVTRPGNAFWKAAFTQPLDSLTLAEEDRATLKEAFFWEPELHVKRVIYVAVPHRGSDDANTFLGKLGRRLVKPPGDFTEFYERVSKANPGAFTKAYAELGSGHLDSVHSLSPRQPTLKILADLPSSHSIATHSIIGNRGRRGPVEDSNDGLVAYWSSHLSYSDSELVVPANHYAFDHPEAVAEIKRILKLPKP